MTDFLGSGLTFPVRTDHRGSIALAHAEEDVRQSIQIILDTVPGERPMRPEFGCDLQQFVFESVDPSVVGRIGDEVRAALERWEPRIDVLDVTCDLSELRDDRIMIEVQYVTRTINDPRNLVHPFYLIPGEERE